MNFIRYLFRGNLRKKHVIQVAPRDLEKAVKEGNYFQQPIKVHANGVAVIKIDGPAPVNIVTKQFLQQTQELYEKQLASNLSIRAVVFISAKPKSFLSIDDFDAFTFTRDYFKYSRNNGLNWWFNLKKSLNRKVPVVCAIEGECLDGGLDWTLQASDSRIAAEETASFGVLHHMNSFPIFGSGYWLPRLIGFKNAKAMYELSRSHFDIWHSTVSLTAQEALSLGLIDAVVKPGQSLEDAAVQRALALADGTIQPRELESEWQVHRFKVFYLFPRLIKELIWILMGGLH